MTAVHAALIGSNPFLRNVRVMVSNSTAHAMWTGCAACHWNGQAHVLSVMNAKTCVSQRLHARFRPLAYAARSRPRGSIGSPPGRGAEAYTIRSGHVSAPDPRLALIKAWVFFVPESWDPVGVARTPHRGVQDPSQGSVSCPWRFWTLPGGSVCICRGPAPSHRVRTHC